MKKFVPALVLLAFILQGCNNKPEDDKMLLRVSYDKGFTQNLAYTIGIKTPAGDYVNERIVLSLKMVSAKERDGHKYYTFKGQISELFFDINMAGQKHFYDSTQKDAKNQSEVVAREVTPIIKAPVSFVMSDRGIITDAEGFEVLGNFTSPSDILKFQVPLPEEEVPVGYMWKDSLDYTKTTYKVMSAKGGKVTIGMSSINTMRAMKANSNIEGDYILKQSNGQLIKADLAGKRSKEGVITVTFDPQYKRKAAGNSK